VHGHHDDDPAALARDARVRQLNATGYMHNRLRMLAASFLTKDLGVS
jgi:deoxyribodipyrimidine photo-lyase